MTRVAPMILAFAATALSAVGLAASAEPRNAPVPSGALLFRGILNCPFDPRVSNCEGMPAYRSTIYVVPRPGAPARRLTDRRFDDAAPSWSPDRRRIAFVRHVPPLGFQIWVMGADGRSARRLTRGPVDGSPDWAPDGRSIAFRSGAEVANIHVIRPDGTGRRNVTRNERGVNAYDPTWSRDGRRLAFRRVATPVGSGIYSIGVDGTGLRRLARGGLDPDWAPSGHRIAYVARDRAGEPGWQVLTMGVNGGGKRLVTSGGSNVSPSWSPDSGWIAFSRNERVAIVRADGTGLRWLTQRRAGFTIDGLSW